MDKVKRLWTAPVYFTDQNKVPASLREHFDKGGQLYQIERYKGRVLLSTTPDGLERPDIKLVTGYAKAGDVLTRLALSDDEWDRRYIPEAYKLHEESGGFILTPDPADKPDTRYEVFLGRMNPKTHLMEGYFAEEKLSILQVDFLKAETELSPEEAAFAEQEFPDDGNSAGHAVALDVQMHRVGEFSVMDDRTFLDTVLAYYEHNDITPGNEAIYNLARFYDGRIKESEDNPCLYHDGKHPCMDSFRTMMNHMFTAESIKDVPVQSLDTDEVTRVLTPGSHEIMDHEDGYLCKTAMHCYQNNLHAVVITVKGSDLVYEDIQRQTHVLGHLDDTFLAVHRDMDGRQGFLIVHDPDNGPHAGSRVSPEAAGGVVFDLSRPTDAFKVRKVMLSDEHRARLGADGPFYMKSEPKNSQTIISPNPDSCARNGYEMGIRIDMNEVWQEVKLRDPSLLTAPPVIREHIKDGGKLYVQGMPDEGRVIICTEADGVHDFRAQVFERDIRYVTLEDERAADLAFADAVKGLSDDESLKL